jgi:hypothetical protein
VIVILQHLKFSIRRRRSATAPLAPARGAAGFERLQRQCTMRMSCLTSASERSSNGRSGVVRAFPDTSF